ncbi:hypothetical protein CY34DRAFT_19158 [Suillus luteus UH-Slu-Lm8-n1]|uniref:Uncharacterized protein n=1 Tax=Suillus luteus UH-Slu-Lm8-n1 TaxID=930992 RepID=A0A0C9ZSK8_9AGAM|nr:hypothetical protein CY34DRAFT_19158 [Suillus luteus UH-Slu-Lm8-n1]
MVFTSFSNLYHLSQQVRSPLDGLIIEPVATSSSAYSATTLPSESTLSSSDTSLPATDVNKSSHLPSSSSNLRAPVVMPPMSSATHATSLALKKELVATDSELYKREPPKK